MILDAEGHGTHEEARPISTPQHTDGHPWCVEHDPSGTCLGDLHPLPHEGAAWLESGIDDGVRRGHVVVALARPGTRGLPRLTAAEARDLAGTLTALADRLEPAGSSE